MNVQQNPTITVERPDMPNQSETHLQGRGLLLARGLWIALVIITLAIFFGSLPANIAQLLSICPDPSGTACTYTQLTSEQAGMLKGIELSSGAYAASMVALTLVSVVVCLVVSTLIIWRRSDDRMALLVALALVTFGPITMSSTMAATPSPWQVPNECLYFLALTLLVLVFLLFPSGQFVPRCTRWTLAVFLVGQASLTFFPTAPFAQNTIAAQIVYYLLLGEVALFVVVQLYRYRRVSSPLERQQTKWVVFGFAVPIIFYIGGTVLYLIFPALAEANSPYGAPYQLAFPFPCLVRKEEASPDDTRETPLLDIRLCSLSLGSGKRAVPGSLPIFLTHPLARFATLSLSVVFRSIGTQGPESTLRCPEAHPEVTAYGLVSLNLPVP